MTHNFPSDYARLIVQCISDCQPIPLAPGTAMSVAIALDQMREHARRGAFTEAEFIDVPGTDTKLPVDAAFASGWNAALTTMRTEIHKLRDRK